MITLQSGRSMIEMLGVLAVIGVLSIGGLMGYSLAISKYRSNEVVKETSMACAELMTTRNQKNADISDMISNINKVSGVTATAASLQDKENAGLSLKFTDKALCQKYLETMSTNSDVVVDGTCE